MTTTLEKITKAIQDFFAQHSWFPPDATKESFSMIRVTALNDKYQVSIIECHDLCDDLRKRQDLLELGSEFSLENDLMELAGALANHYRCPVIIEVVDVDYNMLSRIVAAPRFDEELFIDNAAAFFLGQTLRLEKNGNTFADPLVEAYRQSLVGAPVKVAAQRAAMNPSCRVLVYTPPESGIEFGTLN